jgi:hypothetical protein
MLNSFAVTWAKSPNTHVQPREDKSGGIKLDCRKRRGGSEKPTITTT